MKAIRVVCLVLLVMMCLGVPVAQAQTEEKQVKPTVEYTRLPRAYTIESIAVEGAKNYDDYMLIGLSGLMGLIHFSLLPKKEVTSITTLSPLWAAILNPLMTGS